MNSYYNFINTNLMLSRQINLTRMAMQSRRGFASHSGLTKVCQTIIKDIKEAGTYKTERVISSPQDMRIVANGKNVLNFCANNYLGLANHPRVV
jgi:hypothetical protein